MKILWISSLAWSFSNKYVYEVNGTGAVSGSLFQQAMIEGIEKNGHEVDIISDYPYKKIKLFHKEINWSHNDVAKDVIVRKIGLPYFSLIYKELEIQRVVKNKLKNKNYDVVVVYLIHYPFLKSLATIKKYAKNVKTILICPDLPDMMDLSLKQKKFKSLLKKFDKSRIDKTYKNVDGYILFAEKMKDKLPINNKPYTIIEGVASVENLNSDIKEKSKYILHAGTLHKNNGIEEIIEAMNYVKNKEICLKIYGTGDLCQYIIDIGKNNPKIQFCGFIDRKELFEKQKEALILVNARNPNDDYTKYSFPSKTFEYLYSGTPFLTTKLEGIPKEYNQYLFMIDNNDPISIANKIDYICENYEMCLEKSQEAKKFIIEMKNKEVQSQKLIDFIKNMR